MTSHFQKSDYYNFHLKAKGKKFLNKIIGMLTETLKLSYNCSIPS